MRVSAPPDRPSDARSAERAFSVSPDRTVSSSSTPRPASAPPAPGDALAVRVRALAEEAVVDTDLYVVDVEVRGFQGSRVVSVYADAPDGAGSDDLARLSRSLGFVLDTEDLIKGRYRLDVSSPGADRPLTDRRQYPRHVGRPLAVTFERDGEEVTAQAPLEAVTDDGVVLEGADAPIPFDSIRDARVVLPW